MKKNSLKVLLLNVITLGLYTFYIGKKLDVYENVWYRKWYLWFLGFILGIIPGLIMFLVFYIKIGCDVSKKLNVPFDRFYSYPYVWLLCLIVPIVGWSLFIVLNIYVHTWYCLYLDNNCVKL